jgi:alkylated DNA nucleotide flippase Atl1
MYQRKSWQEKMNNPSLPKVFRITPKMRPRFGTGVMVIPSPHDVDAFIRTVPKGRVVTVREIREYLAGKYAVDKACPLTTGIFVWLTAEAAEEAARAGKKRITPYWRVVKDDGSLNPKFPGGVEAQAERLRDEGHAIDTSRRIPRVVRGAGTSALPRAIKDAPARTVPWT